MLRHGHIPATARSAHLSHQFASSSLRYSAEASGRPQAAVQRHPRRPRADAKAKAGRSDDEYPTEQIDASADDGLFPRRQPGAFPAVVVRPTLRSRLASAVGLEDTLGGRAEIAETAATDEKSTAYDPLRDGPLRYCGYANECGEAFVAWIPLWGVPASYAVAITYVLVDTYDKYARAKTEAKQELDSINLDPSVNESKLVTLLASERALDTVVWQMLASVAIPGFIIHTIVGFVQQALVSLESTDRFQEAFVAVAPTFHMQAAAFAEVFDKSVPTAIGLAAIPFIVHPIDEAVHAVMNVSMRPAVKKFVCGMGGGSRAGLALCADCIAAEDDKAETRN